MAKTKLLLVDDEPVFGRNFKNFMDLHDYDCHVAIDGKAGIEILLQERPDILILDVLMPNMDGYTMLREMKKKNIQIPCIIVTAREKLKDLFDIEQISRFVPKPFDMEKIKGIIEEVLQEEKENSMEDMNESQEPNPFAGKKILLIEDELKLGENLKSYLEMREFTVNHAINGEEGLKLLDSFGPDLVISDIIMPEMDGYSMLKQLKKIRGDVPVIILTGKDKLKDLFEVEGIEGFLTKPFNLVEVENKIKEVLSKINK